jgi:hypothetical protein
VRGGGWVAEVGPPDGVGRGGAGGGGGGGGAVQAQALHFLWRLEGRTRAYVDRLAAGLDIQHPVRGWPELRVADAGPAGVRGGGEHVHDRSAMVLAPGAKPCAPVCFTRGRLRACPVTRASVCLERALVAVVCVRICVPVIGLHVRRACVQVMGMHVRRVCVQVMQVIGDFSMTGWQFT